MPQPTLQEIGELLRTEFPGALAVKFDFHNEEFVVSVHEGQTIEQAKIGAPALPIFCDDGRGIMTCDLTCRSWASAGNCIDYYVGDCYCQAGRNN